MPLRMFDLRNKLEMFAVKTGLKPAFLGSRSMCESRKELTSLKQIAIIMGLEHRTRENPPLYCSRKPKVNGSFLKVYYNQKHFEALWVYSDPRVEAKINKCMSGDLNEGYVLGYPECCINWHEEYRTLEVESEFQDLENHMARNPFILTDIHIETEEGLYGQVLSMSYPKEENEKVWRSINRHLIETYKRYPYVPHWACSACLEGKSKETEKLNARYEELLARIGSNFQKEFLDNVEQAVQAFEDNNQLTFNDF